MASKVWDRQKFKQKSKTKFLLKLSKINWYLTSVAVLNRVGCVERGKYWIRLEALASKRARVTWSVANLRDFVLKIISAVGVCQEKSVSGSHTRRTGTEPKQTNKQHITYCFAERFWGINVWEVIRCALKPNSSFMSRLAVFVKKKLRRIGTWTALLSERKGIPVDSSLNLALYEIALNHSWCCDVHVFTS